MSVTSSLSKRLIAFALATLAVGCTVIYPANQSPSNQPSILVFSKTTGYRHEEAIPAANEMFKSLAAANGWDYTHSEDAALFNKQQLDGFDVIIFNNVIGEFFTSEQRKAFQTWVEAGGGFVGVHGSGADTAGYQWRWYVDRLIGAEFTGHPVSPQFQEARLIVNDGTHPATRHLGNEWIATDEWYSFAAPPAENYNILISIDETSYTREGWPGPSLDMGENHPLVWWHCQGAGRSFYSSLGHRAVTYADPDFISMMEGAVNWASRQQGDGC